MSVVTDGDCIKHLQLLCVTHDVTERHIYLLRPVWSNVTPPRRRRRRREV